MAGCMRDFQQRLLAVVVLAQLFVLSESRTASGARGLDAPTRTAIGVLALLFVLCGGGIGWCMYLEGQPATKVTRIIFLLVLATATCIDLALCVWRYVAWWMLPTLLLLNCWGALDAVLRFPVLHGFDSAFSCKQLLLLLLRGILYVVGAQSSLSKTAMFAVLILNVLGLPLMYVLALPLDDMMGCDQQVAARDVVDKDLAVRVWRFTTDASSRRQCVAQYRRRGFAIAASVARTIPITQRVFCYFDPRLQRALHKSTRCV